MHSYRMSERTNDFERRGCRYNFEIYMVIATSFGIKMLALLEQIILSSRNPYPSPIPGVVVFLIRLFAIRLFPEKTHTQQNILLSNEYSKGTVWKRPGKRYYNGTGDTARYFFPVRFPTESCNLIG